MDNSKKANLLLHEIQQMFRHTPSPLSTIDFTGVMFPSMNMRGHAQAITFYEKVLDELKERVANKIAVFPGEKYRICYEGIPPWQYLGKFLKDFASHGVTLLDSAYDLVWRREILDPVRPLESLAEAMYLTAANTGSKTIADWFIQRCKENSADGLVVALTCPCVYSTFLGVAEIVREELGIPVMVLDYHQCDVHQFSWGDIESKLDIFMEIVTSKPSGERLKP